MKNKNIKLIEISEDKLYLIIKKAFYNYQSLNYHSLSFDKWFDMIKKEIYVVYFKRDIITLLISLIRTYEISKEELFFDDVKRS